MKMTCPPSAFNHSLCFVPYSDRTRMSALPLRLVKLPFPDTCPRQPSRKSLADTFSETVRSAERFSGMVRTYNIFRFKYWNILGRRGKWIFYSCLPSRRKINNNQMFPTARQFRLKMIIIFNDADTHDWIEMVWIELKIKEKKNKTKFDDLNGKQDDGTIVNVIPQQQNKIVRWLSTLLDKTHRYIARDICVVV